MTAAARELTAPAARPLTAERLLRFAAYWRDPALHLLLIVVGYRLAFELRFDFNTPPGDAELFWISLPLLVLLRLATYAGAGVFRAYWLHFGLQDLLTLALAVTISSIAFVMVLFLSHLFPGVPVLFCWWTGPARSSSRGASRSSPGHCEKAPCRSPLPGDVGR